MRLALKIDVDTYRGIEDGATRLAAYLASRKIPASFFVTLGPDESGWAALRLFRHRGFLKKMQRTSALSVYGWRTVLSGTLFPPRPMGNSFKEKLLSWRDSGFEVSPHGYNHIRWHDRAAEWNESRAQTEFERTAAIYRFIFDRDPESFAAPGWQAGKGTWAAMEKKHLLYHSDSRGEGPYFPKIGGEVLKTLEIPTTLPTWDEMLAWPDVTPENLVERTFQQFKSDKINVWTLHAEFEGNVYFPQFKDLMKRLEETNVEWVFLPAWARELMTQRNEIPCSGIEQAERPGRAGKVTCQSHG